MSFHVEELQKIQESTEGFFRKNLRSEIAQKIRTFDHYVNQIKSADGAQREQLLKKYLEIAQGLRHSALAAGATSAKDPKWTATAVVESWIALLRSENQSDISKGEEIINRMR